MNLYLKDENDVIAAVRFEGMGCANSPASASLMPERMKGMKVDEAEALFGRFHDLVTHAHPGDGDTAALGMLTVLLGVREYPARVNSARLAWHTLLSAHSHHDQPVTMELPCAATK